MKKHILLTILTAATFLATPAISATLSITPSTQTKFVGQSASVDVELSGSLVGAFDLDVSWNSAIVSFSSIDFSSELGIFNVETLGDFTALANSINAYNVSLLSVAELGALQGDPVLLFTLNFTALSVGISPVNITLVNSLGDENGIQVDPLTIVNGEIKVINRDGGEIPEPATYLLFSGGLAILAVLRRRG